jgi:hypothetical protein
MLVLRDSSGLKAMTPGAAADFASQECGKLRKITELNGEN